MSAMNDLLCFVTFVHKYTLSQANRYSKIYFVILYCHTQEYEYIQHHMSITQYPFVKPIFLNVIRRYFSILAVIDILLICNSCPQTYFESGKLVFENLLCNLVPSNTKICLYPTPEEYNLRSISQNLLSDAKRR